MDELNKKIENLEKLKSEKAEKQRQLDEEERKKQQQREAGNKNFLGNIKSFNIDDM